MVKVPRLSNGELDDVGHALSTLVQQRYVWLFSHLSRALLLTRLDQKGMDGLPATYAFSQVDETAGRPSLAVEHLIVPVLSTTGVFAESDDGIEKFDHEYVREVTRTGLRGTFLVAFQSYLEYFKVESIARRYNLPLSETLHFLRQARNIVCHAQGSMAGERVQACSWRHLKIERCDRIFKLSDFFLLQLVDDIAEELVLLLTSNGRHIDFVTLNLGFSIPALAKHAEHFHPQNS
jgi:hypothetical protein